MKKKNIHLICFIIVFTFVFIVGCRLVYDNVVYKGYQYPIYISEELSFEKISSNTYNVRCQFTNLTSSDVKIDKLHIYFSGREDSDTYIYDNQYLYDIVVPANGTYDVLISNYWYPVEFGGYIKSCIIDGKECNSIQYSNDGKTFEGPTSIFTTIVWLLIGIIGDVVCIIFIIKNNKYNKTIEKND